MGVLKLYCLKINRGQDGSISSAVLSDGTNTSEVFKDDIKNKLVANIWNIDRLYLSKDGRLLEKVKDTLISDYEESCANLGIEPLKIEKVDNDYLIKDFPSNCKNIIIPDFVSGVHMSKRIGNGSKQSQVTNSQLNINSSLPPVDKETAFRKIDKIYEMLKIHGSSQTVVNKYVKELLDEINDNLNYMYSENKSIENQVKSQLGDINSLIEDIKNSQLTMDNELSTHLNDMKVLVQENSSKILEVKTSMVPFLNNISNDYINSLNSDSNDNLDIIGNLPNTSGFVDEKDYFCLDEIKYNTYFQNKDDYYHIVPFDKINLLLSYYSFYSNIYDKLSLVFKEYGEEEILKLAEFEDWVSPILSATESFSMLDPLSLINGSVSGIKDTSKYIYKKLNVSKLNKKFEDMCENPRELDLFYDITDKDIVKYLIEYNYGRKVKKINKLEYSDLFKLFDSLHSNELEVSFNEEEEKRIALSYIISIKIMERFKNMDIGIKMKPYFHYEDPILSKDYNLYSEDYIDSYINLYDGILIYLIYSYLVILGFKPKYAKVKIIDNFISILNLTPTSLSKEDMKTLYFNLDNY